MHARAYTWAKVDARRAVLHGIVSPMQRTETMGKIVFAVDESGSITDKQLAAMGAHIKDILNDVNPKEVVVMYFHSIVSHVDVFTDMGGFVLESHGTGGTCFEPIFEKVQEEHSDAQLVCVLTDLYGSFPDGFEVCDTLWISNTEGVGVPFGEVICADFNEG
jgi:predicted metal-dependent peptidase